MLAVDGTKVKANAALSANRSYEQIAREVFEQAAEVDAAEDELYGDARGDELPDEWADPRGRRERLRAALDELQAAKDAELAAHEAHLQARAVKAAAAGRRALQGRKPKPPDGAIDPQAKVNMTDPQSRIVKTPTGFCQGYNAQVVATEQQIIVAADLVARSPDGGLLEPMIDKAAENLAAAGIADQPDVALADAGYWDSGQIQRLAARGIQPLVAPDNQRRQTPAAGGTRHGPLARYMRRILDTPHGSELYAKRKTSVEPIFGQIKHNRRADRFSRRGLAACRSEFSLLAATHNLLKLHRAAPTAA